MIVKTFIGQDAKEIEERIFHNYGPEALILTTIELSPGQIEVSFGIEEEDFVIYQKKIRATQTSEGSTGFSNEEMVEEEDDAFWDEDTIPDVEYIATTTSNVLENAIEKRIVRSAHPQSNHNLVDFLKERGLSSEASETIISRLSQPVDLDHKEESNELFQCMESFIRCTPDTPSFDEQKLLTISSIEGVDTSQIIRKLVLHLQGQGKAVRAALVTDEPKKSQEYDIVHGWEELNDYVNNYIHKCDHLFILCRNVEEFLKQWPSAHALHLISALWKPSDIASHLDKHSFHKNSSVIIRSIESTVTPGSIIGQSMPPIRFLDIHDSPLRTATPRGLAKTVLWGMSVLSEEAIDVQNLHHS